MRVCSTTQEMARGLEPTDRCTYFERRAYICWEMPLDDFDSIILMPSSGTDSFQLSDQQSLSCANPSDDHVKARIGIDVRRPNFYTPIVSQAELLLWMKCRLLHAMLSITCMHPNKTHLRERRLQQLS